MKKAYELSTLTGTQVLLLVVSETGLVYTFTTAKLQPLVTQPEGKNLIQACLNAPHGTLPSTMPVGTPLGRSANVGPSGPSNNIPGGLAIGQAGGGVKEDEDAGQDEDESVRGGRATTGEKRRRASSNATPPQPNSRGPPTSPHNPNSSIPPPLSIPPGSTTSVSQPTSAHPQGPQPQMNLGSPTSPQQSHNTVPGSSSAPYSPPYPHAHAQHSHHSQGTDSGMYGTSPHLMSSGYSYPGGQAAPPGGQLSGLANAAQQHGHWTPPPPPQQSVAGQGGHYTRR